MYFVEAGGVVCVRNEDVSDSDQHKEIGRAGPGEYVGELALISEKPRAATVIVDSEFNIDTECVLINTMVE